MKRPPFLATYAVAALAIGLGAYIYFVESKREMPPEGGKKKERVFTLDRAKVKAVTLDPAEGDDIRLVKEKDQWRMAAPLEAPAASAEVDSLITSVESLEVEAVAVESPSAVAEYGLDKPKLTLTVAQEGAPELKLELGEKTPDGGAHYARIPGRPRVFTVGSHVESTLVRKPFDFRDRDLVHVKREDVRTLDVTSPEGSYSLAREGTAGEWAFTRPLVTRAGRWSVDGLLGNLESLRMESVAAEEATDVKPYGLDKPTHVVALTLQNGERKRLEIGATAGDAADKKYYARTSSRPLVAVIPGAIVDEMAKGMGELRAKRLLEVATYEVNGFDAEVAGAKRVYARSTTKDKDGVETSTWKRTAPDAKDLETSKVQDALFAIGGVDVVEFIDQPAAPATYGLDAPTVKVTLRHEGGKPPASFELAEKDGAAYARRAGDQSVLKVDPKKAADLIKAFKEL